MCRKFASGAILAHEKENADSSSDPHRVVVGMTTLKFEPESITE
jgi:hypothetical protein